MSFMESGHGTVGQVNCDMAVPPGVGGQQTQRAIRADLPALFYMRIAVFTTRLS